MVPLARRAACLALLLGACTPTAWEEARYEERFALDGLPRVELRGLSGGLELRAAGDSELVARGTAWAAGASRADALANLDGARLTRRVQGGAMLAVFDPPLELAGLVDLELDRVSDLPADTACTAHIEGGIAARGLRGELDLATPDGDIAVQGAGPGAVLLRARRGAIAVEAGGPIDATAGGELEIRARGQGGEPVRGATGGGRILLLLEQRDFRILCLPEGGEVAVGEGLDADVVQEPDGSVLVVGGDPDAAREVLLLSAGGDIRIDFLGE